MNRLQPGDWCAVLLVAEALLLDVVLHEFGHSSISTCVRRSWLAKAAAVGLCAHLVARLPHDPLTALGRTYSAWRTA